MAEFRSGQYLTFRIGRHDLAMPADCVRGVLPIHELVSPDNPEPPPVAGRASIGGIEFPVLDLRVKLGLRAGRSGRSPSIVVVERASGLAGFVCDRVSDLIHARAHDYRSGRLRIGRPRQVIDPESLCITP